MFSEDDRQRQRAQFERRQRLAAACGAAGVSKAAVARKAGMTTAALDQWIRRGDSSRRGTLTTADIAWCISHLSGIGCHPDALRPGSKFRVGFRYGDGLVTDIYYVATGYGEVRVEVSEGDLIFGPSDPKSYNNLWGIATAAHVATVREMLATAERSPEFTGWYDGLEEQFKAAGVYAGPEPSSVATRLSAVVIIASLRRKGEFVDLIDNRFAHSPSELQRFVTREEPKYSR